MILRETKGLRFDSCHVTRSWSKMQHTGRLHSSDRTDVKQSQSQARDGPVFVVTSRWPPIAFRIFDSTSISLSLRCGSSIAPMSFHIRVNSGKIFSSRSRDDRSGERRAVKFNGMTQEKRVPSSTSAGKITGSSRERRRRLIISDGNDLISQFSLPRRDGAKYSLPHIPQQRSRFPRRN